jgi:hypothetical protein
VLICGCSAEPPMEVSLDTTTTTSTTSGSMTPA